MDLIAVAAPPADEEKPSTASSVELLVVEGLIVEGLIVGGLAVEGLAVGAAVGRPSKARVPTEAADSNGSLALI